MRSAVLILSLLFLIPLAKAQGYEDAEAVNGPVDDNLLPPKAGYVDVHLTNRKTGKEIDEVGIRLMRPANPPKLIWHWVQSAHKPVVVQGNEDLLIHVDAHGFKEWDRSAGNGLPIRLKSGEHLKLDVQLEPDPSQRLTEAVGKLIGSLVIGSFMYVVTLLVLFVKRLPFRVMHKASMLVGAGFSFSELIFVIGFPFRPSPNPRWMQESPSAELKEIINHSIVLGVLALTVGMAVRLVRRTAYRADEPKTFWWIVGTLFLIGLYLSSI